jgi:hypothetical protein
MNIFYISNDPSEIAKWQVNKHCIKMVLESVMLLCTSHRILDGKETQGKSKSGRNKKQWVLEDSEMDSRLYLSTHQNHPSAIWCRTNISNYNWLHELTIELCKEYTYRYGKIHKCERDGLLDLLKTPPKNIPEGEFTQPTPAMPDYCIIPNDSIASYRAYYIKSKQHLANWSGKVNSRPMPEWFVYE